MVILSMKSQNWWIISTWETRDSMWYELNSTYDDTYGKLYNKTAINDSRNICPAGWTVPQKPDWEAMFDYLSPGFSYFDGYLVEEVGGLLKATSDHWNTPNVNASDAVGFAALPAGGLYLTENIEFYFAGLGEHTRYLIKGSYPEETHYYILFGESENVQYSMANDYVGWIPGSIRCIKE